MEESNGSQSLDGSEHSKTYSDDDVTHVSKSACQYSLFIYQRCGMMILLMGKRFQAVQSLQVKSAVCKDHCFVNCCFTRWSKGYRGETATP